MFGSVCSSMCVVDRPTVVCEALRKLKPLTDATDIGECYTFQGANSDLFFLNRLISDLTGAAALKGSIQAARQSSQTFLGNAKPGAAGTKPDAVKEYDWVPGKGLVPR